MKRNPPKSPKGRGPRGRPPVFGLSPHVDLYGVSRERCEDINFCYRLLDGLVRHLGMHKQAPPYVFRSPEAQFPDKAGLSGWVPLIESGISLHTLTLRGFVTVDIYTCGQLDVEASVRFLSDALETTDLEQHDLDRGSRYHA